MNRFVALTRIGLLGFAAASISLFTACGIDVEVGSTTGTGGPSSGSGGGCSSSSSTTSSTSSTGTGGAPVSCGGFVGLPCGADEFCNYPTKNCGAVDNTGTCEKRPNGCFTVYDPTCGCDGKIYGNDCEAEAAGAGVSSYGGCEPPAGQFPCGAHFCESKTEYCEHDKSDIADMPDNYTCKPLPAKCVAPATPPLPSCECLSGVPCGSTCVPTSNNGLQVTCPGI